MKTCVSHDKEIMCFEIFENVWKRKWRNGYNLLSRNGYKLHSHVFSTKSHSHVFSVCCFTRFQRMLFHSFSAYVASPVFSVLWNTWFEKRVNVEFRLPKLKTLPLWCFFTFYSLFPPLSNSLLRALRFLPEKGSTVVVRARLPRREPPLVFFLFDDDDDVLTTCDYTHIHIIFQ